MTKKFYNKVAKKFGGYAYATGKPKYISEYLNGNPEDIFKDKLFKVSNIQKIALDSGCGDCKFAFGISSHFKKIVGIDTSEELLKVARSKKRSLKNNNVSIFKKDAFKAGFKDDLFDLVFSRRGPTPVKEAFRMLRSRGFFIIIEIGEKDCLDIKKIFGRGQGYKKWNKSVSHNMEEKAKKAGFAVDFSKDFYYNEYYYSYTEIDRFLQGVPIFEDFNSEKDRKLLIKYVNKFQTRKGIKLPRHRVVMVFQKT